MRDVLGEHAETIERFAACVTRTCRWIPSRASRSYASLDLAWTANVEDAVLDHTGPTNAAEVHDPSNHRRDIRSALRSWKRRLTDDEVARIRPWTEQVASVFYEDDE